MTSAAAPAPTRPRAWLWPAIAAWVFALGGGLWLMTSYSLRPGATGDAPADWPAGFARDTSRPTLLLFLHPQCPCSRATVGELAHVLTVARDQFAVVAYVYTPSDADAAWGTSDLTRALRELPGIRVAADADGRLAARFGAITSGQVLLFDRNGALEFSGGITGARGHAGDNAGRRAVLARIQGLEHGLARSSVFGCSLRDELDPLP